MERCFVFKWKGFYLSPDGNLKNGIFFNKTQLDKRIKDLQNAGELFPSECEITEFTGKVVRKLVEVTKYEVV